jgi:hypothetical protein
MIIRSVLCTVLITDEYDAPSDIGADGKMRGRIKTCYLECHEDADKVNLTLFLIDQAQASPSKLLSTFIHGLKGTYKPISTLTAAN